MFKRRDERKKERYLKHLINIAEAFLKARSVYPPDYDGFLEVAGQREVDIFYQTMHLVKTKAKQEIGYCFYWFYDETEKAWKYEFVAETEVVYVEGE